MFERYFIGPPKFPILDANTMLFAHALAKGVMRAVLIPGDAHDRHVYAFRTNNTEYVQTMKDIQSPHLEEVDKAGPQGAVLFDWICATSILAMREKAAADLAGAAAAAAAANADAQMALVYQRSKVDVLTAEKLALERE